MFINTVQTALEATKAIDLQILDVSSLTAITDTMIICTGTSTRHTKALAENLLKAMAENDRDAVGIEGDTAGEWILIDLNDIVVHIMLASTREFYQLESLWDVTSYTVSEAGAA